ncbi:hypothetical protein Ocin01_07280 [Orchesella cincta]|uniref:Uncharacterized protein n=1 Tax=Orchesella cincta TaxID=48709 RepID=A0A1D2N2W4_ORCCI|nr:hypothetical protein Ocin01_07280 [Orchesella cincta]
MILNILFIVFTSIGIFTVHSIPVTKLPSKTSAIFYESPDQEGAKVSYKETAENWSNLPRLFRISNVASPSLLCVRGVWLIYGDSEFRAPTNDDVHLVSGNDNCIKPPDVAAIGSMQPVSGTKFSESSITIYSKGNFASIGLVFSDEGDFGIRQLHEPILDIGSIMVVGPKPWSLISAEGKIICVRPHMKNQNFESIPICYSPDLDQYRVSDFETVAVASDCPGEHDEAIVANFKLLTCKEFGSENIEPLQPPSAIMGRSLGDEGTGEAVLECRKKSPLNTTKFTEDQSKLILDLLKLRLDHDFDSDEQTLWPDAKEDLWKVIPLDTAFDIMLHTVPDNIVNTKYLRIIREFTVFHLNEIWKEEAKEAKVKASKKWKSYKVVTHLLEQCLKAVFKTEDRYNSIIAAAYSESHYNSIQETTHPVFVMNLNHDPVIETAYVVTNYAMALCHELFDYKYNFWDNFVLSFNTLYFRPLEKRWKQPTQILPETFRAILSGFGTKTEYKRIAFATTLMLNLTPNLSPFEKYYKNKK